MATRFGDVVRRWRETQTPKKLTQTELGNLVGKSLNWVQKVEASDVPVIHDRNYEDLARVMKISTAQLDALWDGPQRELEKISISADLFGQLMEIARERDCTLDKVVREALLKFVEDYGWDEGSGGSSMKIEPDPSPKPTPKPNAARAVRAITDRPIERVNIDPDTNKPRKQK